MCFIQFALYKQTKYILLLYSLSFEEEILIIYYGDGYLLFNYMTIVNIDLLNRAVLCTDDDTKFFYIVDVK
ncbi:YolD-like family protein [Bacillus toyonensis]|nr:YolD-like family protein [Bacillus toyonensis]MBE7163726.1 YolD-like family protein [Bacillus toyonensis]